MTESFSEYVEEDKEPEVALTQADVDGLPDVAAMQKEVLDYE